MREFEVPSQLFRWFLKNTSTGNETYSYEACFPRYLAAAKGEGYLWRSYDRRLQMLIDIVGNGKGKSSPLRVLEVGCGFGHDLLWTALAGAQAVGIDVKSEHVEICRLNRMHLERHIGNSIAVDIRRTNLMAMSGEVFDLIYMKDVFHHLEPRDAIVAKLASLMAPGGRILIVEPNAWNPLIQLQMFRIRGFNTIVEKTDAATGERFLYGNERLVAGRLPASLLPACRRTRRVSLHTLSSDKTQWQSLDGICCTRTGTTGAGEFTTSGLHSFDLFRMQSRTRGVRQPHHGRTAKRMARYFPG